MRMREARLGQSGLFRLHRVLAGSDHCPLNLQPVVDTADALDPCSDFTRCLDFEARTDESIQDDDGVPCSHADAGRIHQTGAARAAATATSSWASAGLSSSICGGI
jgi:hypothetical protein